MPEMMGFMQGMVANHLRFTVQVEDRILLEEQSGSAIRGALYTVLSERFCTDPQDKAIPGHAERCPVCWLLTAENPMSIRGIHPPRPLTVQPPLPGEHRRGETFEFGITLLGSAQKMLLFIIRGVKEMGHVGIGRGRGHFKLLNVKEYNPLYDAERVLLRDGATVENATLTVTNARVCELVMPDRETVTIDLLTPLRLTAKKKLVQTPDPEIFMRRLLERAQQLTTYYSMDEDIPDREDWIAVYEAGAAAASGWRLAFNETRWDEAFSGSQRQKRRTPIGGLVGRFRWEGAIDSWLYWLLWGQSLHVGKNAVKGNGYYRIVG